MEKNKTMTLFIIEDSILFATALKQFLHSNFKNFKYEVSVQIFDTSESCIESLMNSKAVKPDIIILDYFLNSRSNDAMNGLNALSLLKIYNPDAHIIFLSGQNEIEIAIETIHTGACDYIVKNKIAFQKVLKSVQRCLNEFEKPMAKDLTLKKEPVHYILY